VAGFVGPCVNEGRYKEMNSNIKRTFGFYALSHNCEKRL